MFSKKCFCKENISKMVRPLLAAPSVNGLMSSGGPTLFYPISNIINNIDMNVPMENDDYLSSNVMK